MARRKTNKQDEEVLVDIVEVRDNAQNFFERNQNVVLGVLVGAVLIFGGLFAYNNFYKQPRQKEAVDQIVQAEKQFEKDSFALALTNPGGGYYGFLDIIDNYGGTKVGNLAKYYAGVSYLNLGKYDAAISYLEDFSPAGDITPTMKFGALGDAHSELQNFDKALSYYKKAANSDNEALAPYYLKKLGMLHEYQDRPAEARKAYEKIKEEYPTTPIGREIDKYLARVAG